jgi:hypothetical protein
MLRLLIACAAALLIANRASAIFEYTQDVRTVFGFTGNDGQQQYPSSVYGTFGGSANAVYVQNGEIISTASGRQTSWLYPNQIFVAGVVSATTNGLAGASGGSQFSVSFDVTTEDAEYRSSYLATPDHTFYSGTGSFLRWDHGQPVEGYPLEGAGILPRGHYQLTLQYSAYIPTGSSGSSLGLYTFILGIVTHDDYLIWRNNYGLTGENTADTNFDGVVDAADLTLWRKVTLAVTPPESAAGGATAISTVPEPSALVLLLACLSATSMRWRRLR